MKVKAEKETKSHLSLVPLMSTNNNTVLACTATATRRLLSDQDTPASSSFETISKGPAFL